MYKVDPYIPSEGAFDSNDSLITKMGEAGIYTLVDAHQDVFARTICGEGVPDFYAKEVIGDGASCLGPLDIFL